jgi:hypothetical protein
MKIKKPMKVNAGPAIADRLKLETPANVSNVNVVGKKSSTYALVFGVAALIVVGILTYILYSHWKFLMPA